MVMKLSQFQTMLDFLSAHLNVVIFSLPH